MLFLARCEDTTEIGLSNEEFFAITKMFNSGKYTEAKEMLDTVYKQIDYSMESDGFNKMNQYRLYYDVQKMYDDEMTVLFKSE